MSKPPILVIGHVTRDLIGGEERLGGAAAYVALAQSARGRRVDLVTRAPEDPLLEPLADDPRIRLHLLPSESFTTFRHHDDGGERRLTLEARAPEIATGEIPPSWRDRPLVFLVPVIGECDAGLLSAFPDSRLIAGIQGWLRAVEPDGRLRPSAPPEALLNARLAAVTLSEADHPEADALARHMAGHCRLVAVTRGEKALTVFEQSTEYDVPIEPVARVRDTIGAGDVFTALLGLSIIDGRSARAAVEEAARGAARYVAEGLAGLFTEPGAAG